MQTATIIHNEMLQVRQGMTGWEVLCPPGNLAQFLNHLSLTNKSVTVENVGGQAMAVIPMTVALDQALVSLVDMFITLRYDAGNVQLRLFSTEDIGDTQTPS